MAVEYSAVLEYVLKVINGYGPDQMPTSFDGQCKAVKNMLKCDTTGIINTLLDYAIASAKQVKYTVETNNSNLTDLLNSWLKNLNNQYSDKIPSGVAELAKEYFSERWKKSSLIGVRINWAKQDGLYLPDAMYLVDGSSLEINKTKQEVLGGVTYLLNKQALPKRGEDFIVRKPFAGWNDTYPIPYLFMRGTYKNFVGIDMLKTKGNDILNKIVPYLLLLLKGNDEMTKKGQVISQAKMDEAQTQLKTYLEQYNTTSDNGTPVVGFPYDTKLEHLIPNIKNMVSKELYDQGYAAVLASLGVVEVINVGSLSRRETIFNPKPFVAETQNGVDDFRKLLEDVVNLIITKNKDNHRKHFSESNDIKVSASTLTLKVESMIEEISKAFPRGAIDYQTYIEAMGLDFDVIKRRAERDDKEGLKILFYPKLTQNTEQNEDPIFTKENNQKFITQADLESRIDITENYIRIRQVEPSEFDEKSFRTIVIDEEAGIKAVIGRKKGEKNTIIQSYLFDRKKWNKKDAMVWVKKHGGIAKGEIDSEETVALEKCKKCGKEFDYFSTSENGMDSVKCPNCGENLSQSDIEFGELILGGPYNKLSDLPPYVKKYSKENQKKWMIIWNSAYRFALKKYDGDTKRAEQYAFSVANSRVRG